MVFKLIRTDTAEPCKIQLPLGSHLLGRGKFLDCDDKRVSRNHGELIVTDDTITIKALHHNPCFFIKKGTEDTQILKQYELTNLSHGDKFGLLPTSYWYELLHCTLIDINKQSPEISSTVIDVAADGTIADVNLTGRMDNLADSNKTDVDNDNDVNHVNELTENGMAVSPLRERENVGEPEEGPISPLCTADSPSLIPDNGELQDQQSSTQNYDADDRSIDNQAKEPKTAKRPCSSDDEVDEGKRIKTEPADVKQEPEDVKPGPSNDQVDPSKASDNAANKVNDNAGNGVPAAPTGPGRERCMYGAGCYRKNPLHKAQFSHPADADWGLGPRGVCPWGRSCRKPDPRHWRDHDHPPGVMPPAPQPRPVGKRKKKPVSGTDSEDDAPSGLIVTGKRQRKTIKRQSWSGSESENDDPYQTDESDEWQPGTTEENPQSQGYTQDLD